MTYKITAPEKPDQPLAGTIVDYIEAANVFDARDKFLQKHPDLLKSEIIIKINKP
jgi:hypothetical protein